MNNFDTVMAIVAALESSAVHRLKKTWAVPLPFRFPVSRSR
jgi:hypothetical protein